MAAACVRHATSLVTWLTQLNYWRHLRGCPSDCFTPLCGGLQIAVMTHHISHIVYSSCRSPHIIETRSPHIIETITPTVNAHLISKDCKITAPLNIFSQEACNDCWICCRRWQQWQTFLLNKTVQVLPWVTQWNFYKQTLCSSLCAFCRQTKLCLLDSLNLGG